MKCGSCNREIASSSVYCAYCGARLTSSDVVLDPIPYSTSFGDTSYGDTTFGSMPSGTRVAPSIGRPATLGSLPDSSGVQPVAFSGLASPPDGRPVVPAGQGIKPAVPAGQGAKPVAPAGQGAKPFVPAGQGAKPVAHAGQGAKQKAPVLPTSPVPPSRSQTYTKQYAPPKRPVEPAQEPEADTRRPQPVPRKKNAGGCITSLIVTIIIIASMIAAIFSEEDTYQPQNNNPPSVEITGKDDVFFSNEDVRIIFTGDATPVQDGGEYALRIENMGTRSIWLELTEVFVNGEQDTNARISNDVINPGSSWDGYIYFTNLSSPFVLLFARGMLNIYDSETGDLIGSHYFVYNYQPEVVPALNLLLAG